MRWLILSAMLLAIGGLPAQEKPGEKESTCSALFGCHRSHPAERIPCPRCQKKQIPANDVACGKCASQAKICQHCGKPRGERKKASRRERDPYPSVTALRKEIAKLKKEKEPSRSIGPLSDSRLENAAVLPAQGRGFRVVNAKRQANFGTDEMVFGLMELGARMHDLYQRDGEFIVGDISAREGGKLAPHLNHQGGRDVDLGLYLCTEDGKPRGDRMVTCGEDGAASSGNLRFDVARNWAFVGAMIENEHFESIRAILLADWLKALLLEHAETELKKLRRPGEIHRMKELIKQAERLIRQPSSSPHDNHYHLSLDLSREDRRGR